MLTLKTPRGLPAAVPEREDEDPSPRFQLREINAINDYYDRHGYVVVKSLIEASKCDEIRRLWELEVKPVRVHMYRQATARVERHVKNNQGWVMNPILNLQSIDPKKYPRFRSFAVEEILANSSMAVAFRALLGDTPKIVQSMYFEGNSATWEHQDSYYLDSEHVGTMAAAWIALEDINADAGRFFVCPGSHKIEMGVQTATNNIADHHEDYIQEVVKEIQRRNLEIRSPRLCKGDVLFWNARTIHGSLDSRSEHHSRSSITCHAIAASHRFLQLQTKVMELPTTAVNESLIYRPKDLAVPRNKLVFWIEARFPKLFYALKRAALRARFKTSTART